MKKMLSLLSIFLLGTVLTACNGTDNGEYPRESFVSIEGTAVFGDSDFGIFRLPENWVTFMDIGGAEGILQYTADGVNIITTQILIGEINARDFAEILLESISTNGYINEEINLRSFGEFDAYFASVGFAGSYFNFFVFERPESALGDVQWFSIEGLPEVVEEIGNMVASTFELN